jgi:pimeloyl-ACP methyl ester carboxylesterase
MRLFLPLVLLAAAAALAQAPAVRMETVLPRATDPVIDSALSAHRAALATSGVAMRGQLFLFLHGLGGAASGGGEITTTAAEQGFHAVALTYPMNVSPAAACTGGSSAACFENFRREILEGVDLTPVIAISRANSVENRALKLLRHLDSVHPGENWAQFDSAGTLRWSKIVLYGHSMGGSNVALLAKLHAVPRLCVSGPATDISQWWTNPATPAANIYGFSHAQDPMYAGQQMNWSTMGLAGTLTDVGASSPPYGNSHRLLATATPAGAGTDFHNSPTMDGATPRDGSNVPIYKPVWVYMMTGGAVTGIRGRTITPGIAPVAGFRGADALGRRILESEPIP